MARRHRRQLAAPDGLPGQRLRFRHAGHAVGPGRTPGHVHRRRPLRLVPLAAGQEVRQRRHCRRAALGRQPDPGDSCPQPRGRHHGAYPGLRLPRLLPAGLGRRVDVHGLAARDIRHGAGLDGVLAHLGGGGHRRCATAVQRRLLRQRRHVPLLRLLHPGRVLCLVACLQAGEPAGHGRNRLPRPRGGQVSALNSAGFSAAPSGTAQSGTAAFNAAENAAMQAALAAAAQGPRGANPLVGAVVVGTDGTHLATGYHRGAGTAHAEADAIGQAKAADRDLRGAAIVVTLEPCNHCGRTGPCAQAIIDAGITDVIYAVDDPHDPAAGGAVTLRAAGVRVRSGLAAEAALDLNRRWFDAVAAKRPFVTLHVAQTLDSRIAASDGTSQWISSPESLADNHALRGRIDAILVGTQTVLIDNPRLTARNGDGEAAGKQPLRAVMGYRGIPGDAAIHGADGNVLHLATRDPREALDQLFANGVRHLMVEGGSRILSAFLAAGLVDELIIYLAPTLLGSGTLALDDLGIGTLADAQLWDWDQASGGAVRMLGRDLRLHLRPATDTSSDSTPRSDADTAAGGN